MPPYIIVGIISPTYASLTITKIRHQPTYDTTCTKLDYFITICRPFFAEKKLNPFLHRWRTILPGNFSSPPGWFGFFDRFRFGRSSGRFPWRRFRLNLRFFCFGICLHSFLPSTGFSRFDRFLFRFRLAQGRLNRFGNRFRNLLWDLLPPSGFIDGLRLYRDVFCDFLWPSGRLFRLLHFFKRGVTFGGGIRPRSFASPFQG